MTESVARQLVYDVQQELSGRTKIRGMIDSLKGADYKEPFSLDEKLHPDGLTPAIVGELTPLFSNKPVLFTAYPGVGGWADKVIGGYDRVTLDWVAYIRLMIAPPSFEAYEKLRESIFKTVRTNHLLGDVVI